MKNKNKKLLTKKEKRILICLAIIIFIIIIGISMLPTKMKKTRQEETKKDDLSENLSSIEETITYLESTYISMEESNQEGIDLDIYLNFKYNLYEGKESKEQYFTNFYEKIAMVTNFKSFRLIDQSKKITITVRCAGRKITEVLINGEKEYYKNEKSRQSKENKLEVETIKLDINSKILNDLINAKWDPAKVQLGTQESTFNKYQIYFDEGYEIKTIQGKIYNIVFTEKYKEKVVQDYKVGDKLEEIESYLGTSYKDQNIIGYKTKDFYIYFTKDEISIYPNYDYDYTEFEKLVKEYNEKKNINDFTDKLTDIWPDYDIYNYDSKYVEIYYTLKGVKISFSSHNKEGIQIYENYKGDLKTQTEDLTDVYYKLDQNLFIRSRTKKKNANRNL